MSGTYLWWIVLFLLMLSFWYFYNWFILSFIPYSTARDANHAYMFYPKMRALNHWYFWDNIDMAVGPQLWYSFIAYWFSLFQPFHGVLWLGLSPDTYAIMMNFWSSFFVLVFGIWLVIEVVWLIAHSTEEESPWYGVTLCLGWFLILQWLSSWMGAFLVFIDNKTDLWVLSLIILALYSGFVFLRSVQENKNLQIYLLAISWFLFAIAWLAKPTALFDVVNFAAFLRATWFGVLWSLGIVMMVIGVIAILKIMWISDYLTTKQGTLSSILWWLLLLWSSFPRILKSTATYIKYLIVWGLAFIATLLTFKLPYYVVSHYFYDTDISPSQLLKWILFGKTHTLPWLDWSDYFPLYTQLWWQPNPATTCTLSSQWLSDPSELYKNLKKAPWSAYNEDVGRYVWYGWKWNPSDIARWILPFKNSRWAFAMDEGCYSFNPFNMFDQNPKILCETQKDWESLELLPLELIQARLTKDSEVYEKFNLLLEQRKKGVSVEQTKINEVETLRRINDYMQGWSIKIVVNQGDKEIYVPYKFLNFFNMTFNWSLQNLSSYYTDIWIIWLLLICFSVFWLFYGIVQKKSHLISINIITLFGRLMWLMIGGGILRYGIWIVIRSILSFIILVWYFFDHRKEVTDKTNIPSILFVILFVAIALFQLVLNMVRITSQGWWWPFLRYKSNFGTVQKISAQGQVVSQWKSSYGYDEILDMQFPHYKKPIEILDTRAAWQGVVIAWTYLRYFMKNQDNAKWDGFLTDFWENISDGNPCLSYLRMKDKKLQYYVIDQNIATVVQWDANKALFDRFFAKLGADASTINEYGAMTMIAKMTQMWFIKLLSTNNIGTKYALSLPDESFSGLSGDQLTILRAKMMAPRFFGEAAIKPIFQIADLRVKNGSFISDFADIFGKTINETKLIWLTQKSQLTPSDLALLTEDEKYVLLQFLGLKQQQSQNPQQYQQTLQTLVMQSISWWSQLMLLEVLQ